MIRATLARLMAGLTEARRSAPPRPFTVVVGRFREGRPAILWRLHAATPEEAAAEASAAVAHEIARRERGMPAGPADPMEELAALIHLGPVRVFAGSHGTVRGLAPVHVEGLTDDITATTETSGKRNGRRREC